MLMGDTTGAGRRCVLVLWALVTILGGGHPQHSLDDGTYRYSPETLHHRSMLRESSQPAPGHTQPGVSTCDLSTVLGTALELL